MVFFVADNIVSSLGMSTKQNFKSLLNGNTGISVVENNDIYNELWYFNSGTNREEDQECFLLHITQEMG